MMQNTPLARLSPSSEISHNTPRILTLGDLSGKHLPPGIKNPPPCCPRSIYEVNEIVFELLF